MVDLLYPPLHFVLASWSSDGSCLSYSVQMLFPQLPLLLPEAMVGREDGVYWGQWGFGTQSGVASTDWILRYAKGNYLPRAFVRESGTLASPAIFDPEFGIRALYSPRINLGPSGLPITFVTNYTSGFNSATLYQVSGLPAGRFITQFSLNPANMVLDTAQAESKMNWRRASIIRDGATTYGTIVVRGFPNASSIQGITLCHGLAIQFATPLTGFPTSPSGEGLVLVLYIPVKYY